MAAGSERFPARRLIRWLLTGLVLAFVLNEGRKLWNSGAQEIGQVQFAWLLPAGLVYAAGWLPSVWFLRRVLSELHHNVGWWPVLRAYYCGHLGKYVPGKAMALIIRAGMLREQNVPTSVSVAATVLETLLVMGVGAGLAMATVSRAVSESSLDKLPDWLQFAARSNWLVPGIVVGVAVFGVCVSGQFVSRVVSRTAAARARRVDSQLELSDATTAEPAAPASISSSLLLQSLPLFAIGWASHGLSLGCVLFALGGDFSLTNDWLACTTAVAAGTSAGFFLLLVPGGIGVREGLIVLILSPLAGNKAAIAAAVLLRVVWFATELLMAAALYWRRPTPPPGSQSTSEVFQE